MDSANGIGIRFSPEKEDFIFDIILSPYIPKVMVGYQPTERTKTKDRKKAHVSKQGLPQSLWAAQGRETIMECLNNRSQVMGSNKRYVIIKLCYRFSLCII